MSLRPRIFRWEILYLWRSLMQSKKVMDQGSRWRVGDGRRVDVWRDHWVPGFQLGLSQFVENQQATPLKVCKIFYENGQWIHELLATWFDYDVVSRISRIPLSVYATKDTIIWTDSKIGMFTVKPAYYKVRKMLDRVQRTSNEARQVWSCIWKATLAPIVKHFMWRLIVNCLPTIANLVKRGLDVNPLCYVCSQTEEDLFHAFFDCTFCKRVLSLFQQDFSSLREVMA